MTAPMIALVAVLGLCVGSFLNVVAWRVPRGESVVRPPSACPGCGRQIRAVENVPVLSWLVLRARCRGCGERISAVYPAVELATGVLFVLVFLKFGLAWDLPAYLYGAAIAVALTVIDIRLHRLPDAIVLPSYVVVAVLLVIAAAGTGDWGALARAAAGGAILFVAYFLMVFAYPAGMGLGDVKLAGILGALLAWVGWGALAVGAFSAFVLGGAFALVLVVLRRAGRGSGIPFGPWMMLGAALGIGAGEQIFSAYLDLML